MSDGLASSSPEAISPDVPEEFIIEAFPDAPYHIGDVLSFRVTYIGTEDIQGTEIQLTFADHPDDILDTASFFAYSNQAIFYWVVDTDDQQSGMLEFRFSISASNLTWQFNLPLLPKPPQRSSEWTTVDTNCCTIHYLSETDAEEQILSIQGILEDETAEAFEQFASQIKRGDSPLEEPLSLVLIPVVVGQGGFAADSAVLTYSDRNWAGIDLEMLGHHEIVHVIDRYLNEGPRPALLSEGIAVFLSGGHYRKGDALERAAALVAEGLYLPLADITDDFYTAQHEISYIEAAGLVAYLSDIWGWESFLEFYFNLPDGKRDSEIISSALESRIGITLADLERDYLDYLTSLSPDDAVRADVRLTIQTYDLIRRYQTLAVPNANFRSAWWPPIEVMLEEGIVGDYAYREKSPFNVIIETLFLEIHESFQIEDYEKVAENCAKITQILDQIEARDLPPTHYGLGWPIHPSFLRTIRH